jgi:hypothetical protein
MALVMVLGLAAPPPAWANGMLSPAQFRDRFVRRLHKLAPDVTVKVVSDAQLELSRPGADTVTSYLNNAYGEYVGDPANLDQFLNGYVGVALQTLNGFPPIRIENLVILIRPRGYFPAAIQQATRPLGGDFLEVLAVNTPKSFEIPRADVITKAFGAIDDKLWDRAGQNSKSLMGHVTGEVLGDGVMEVSCGQGFAGSLLVFDTLWASGQFPGNGPVVVAVGKNELMIAHSGDPKSVSALRAFVAEHVNDPALLSSSLLVRTPNGWATYP